MSAGLHRERRSEIQCEHWGAWGIHEITRKCKEGLGGGYGVIKGSHAGSCCWKDENFWFIRESSINIKTLQQGDLWPLREFSPTKIYHSCLLCTKRWFRSTNASRLNNQQDSESVWRSHVLCYLHMFKYEGHQQADFVYDWTHQYIKFKFEPAPLLLESFLSQTLIRTGDWLPSRLEKWADLWVRKWLLVHCTLNSQVNSIWPALLQCSWRVPFLSLEASVHTSAFNSILLNIVGWCWVLYS